MKYLLLLVILVNCLMIQGVLEWTVVGKATEYGQSVTLFCNVSNCCPKNAGWDRLTPVQRTLFIDLKTGRPNKKYDGKVLKDGYTLIIQNLTKQDLNVSYSCVYGATIGDRKFLLEEDVFTFVTQSDVPTGYSKLSPGEIGAIITGITIVVIVLVSIFIYFGIKRSKKQERKETSEEREMFLNARSEQEERTTMHLKGSKPLITKEEFSSIFAFPYQYGDRTKKWPRSTILLYKYSSNATTKYTAIPENTWSTIYNQTKDEDQPEKHAEEIMIDQLIEIQKHLKDKNESNKGIQAIEVILSYSPCSSQGHNCSTKLLTLKASLEKDIRSDEAATLGTSKDDVSTVAEGMSKLNIGKDKEVAKINIKITFANFYKHNEDNMEGLKELLKNKIELDILTGDKWMYFFDVVGLDKTTEFPKGREDREEEDIKMFAKLMSR